MTSAAARFSCACVSVHVEEKEQEFSALRKWVTLRHRHYSPLVRASKSGGNVKVLSLAATLVVVGRGGGGGGKGGGGGGDDRSRSNGGISSLKTKALSSSLMLI
jgi:hypothetical protein